MGKKIRYDEAAKMIGVGKTTLYAMVCQKRVPHVRLSGRLVLFDVDEIDEWLNSHKIPVSGGPEEKRVKRRSSTKPTS